MNEQTNRPSGDELDFDDFDGATETEDTQTKELDFGEDETPATQPGATTASEKLKIKYNGKEEEYDPITQREEIVTLLQKGKNYDHVVSERDSILTGEELTFLKEMAAEAGIKDTKQFVQKLREDYANQKINKRVEELVSEGMPEEHALAFAKLEQQSKASKTMPQAFDEPDPALTSGYKELFEEYPEALQFKKQADFPEEVRTMIDQGKSPLVAYQKYLLAEAQRKAAIENHNLEVKKRDTGSMQSFHADEADDDFLANFKD